MSAAQRRVTREDIIPDAEFAAQRKARRAALLAVKQLRRVSLGPYCRVIFESYDTMLFQIQEMLLVEKGGDAQVQDELDAYNPMIPQGSELTATVMFEIEDEVRRDMILRRLGGVEDHFLLQVGSERVAAVQEGDVERTREDGKTSSVHFLHFPLTASQRAAFSDPAVQVAVGCDHELYHHLAVLGPAVRAEMAKDFD